MAISLNEHFQVYDRNHVLFREGDASDKFFLVRSGAVICLRASKDRLVPVFYATAQQAVGEEAAMSGAPYTYSAIVAEEAEVVELEAREVKKLFDIAPGWIGNLFGILGERAVDTAEAIAEHRIFSDALAGGQELNAQEENRLRKLIDG